MPRYIQNVLLVHKLLSFWDLKKQCFIIKDQKLPFTADKVSLILGLPNRGKHFELGSARITRKLANDIRKEVLSLDDSTPIPDVVKKFIIYLLSNLFFSLRNYRTPASILSISRDVANFLSNNWPESIRDFLVSEFDAIAKKLSKGQPLGYMNSFVHALIREKDSRFEAMEKFISEQFPTFKPLNIGYQVESSSKTITEEKRIEKQDELKEAPLPDLFPNPLPDPLPEQSKVEVHHKADVIASTCSTSIARRRTLTKKAVARLAPTATAFIQVDTIKSPEARPAAAEIEYTGRPMINENMKMFIDNYLKKYFDKGNIIYSVGNVHIFRSQIDKLLTDQYLDNNHIDAFAILLAEKNKLRPNLYQPFIHVSSLNWYVSHVSKESVRAANLLLMPVSYKEHWTLLVADLKSSSWTFFDSFLNPTHKAVLPDVINHLYEKIGDCFESDIRTWPLTVASGVPTQKKWLQLWDVCL
ncbi:hypothetical protein IEQ34_020260 [Dendrobium chrysotoxum]|uniref:Ubiquitin-like protease family profile domain-containing protein n=1 Tax=Dendrobium chrysotoxum TaxID=161865 RepID=A0AAV7G230_DENCH|nr:hypothetical protein IEQ34_020260 [Dendrobium chrysotoxum]